MSPRNVFETNWPSVTPEEALEIGSKLHTILPELPAGRGYQFVKLSDSRIGVTIETGDTDVAKSYVR